MLNIYLIITLILTIIFHIFFRFVKSKKQNDIDLNEKLINTDFTDNNLVSVENIKKYNKSYNILIVEDDPVNRKILKSQLISAKYQVETANDGYSALNIIDNNKSIDVVLLDIILPDISGFDVCKKIRETQSQFEKPVIMVTSKNKITDLIEGFEVGANDFITKPYNIYELITRINSSITLKNLYRDNTSLKKINSLKSDIVDMAAHDLKSPLTIISGYSNRIMKLTPENSKESDLAEKILNSSNKMLSIITKMLHSSKYENFILNIEDLEINKVIKKSISFYKDMAENKLQSIIFESDKDNYIVKLDYYSFVTIIENLLNNAIKYSPEKSQIIIRVTSDKDSIMIAIKDSGNGFTKEEIDNLFIKFFPFSNKPTKGENSTGLGLYIINDMVKKNNGSIHINSTKGEGSEFIVTFPLKPSYTPHPIQ